MQLWRLSNFSFFGCVQFTFNCARWVLPFMICKINNATAVTVAQHNEGNYFEGRGRRVSNHTWQNYDGVGFRQKVKLFSKSYHGIRQLIFANFTKTYPGFQWQLHKKTSPIVVRWQKQLTNQLFWEFDRHHSDVYIPAAMKCFSFTRHCHLSIAVYTG